jgi:hypothetical protein
MAGGIVADYKVIQEDVVHLPQSGDPDINFEFVLPLATSDSQPAILSFMLSVVREARLSIDLNATRVYNRVHRVHGIPIIPDEALVQRVVGSVARHGRNTATFRIDGGEVSLRSVVLWFQRSRSNGTITGSSRF